MKRKEVNVLNMWHATNLTLNQHWSVIETNAEIRNRSKEFMDLHQELEQYGKTQSNTSVGVTEDKNTLRKLAEKLAFVVAANLRAWARANNNKELMENMTYSKTDLLKMDDAQLLKVVANINDLAIQHHKEIISFGTTEEKLKEFGSTVNQLRLNVGKPRTAINVKTVATTRIAEIIREGQELLDEMDDLIYNFEDEYPDFLTQYKKARVIIDRGGKGSDEAEEEQ